MPAPCCASRDWLISREPSSVTVPSESQRRSAVTLPSFLWDPAGIFTALPPPRLKSKWHRGLPELLFLLSIMGKTDCVTPSPHSICSLNLKWGLGVTPLKLCSVLVIVFRWDSGQWCCWVGYLCFYCMEYNICCSCVEYLFCLRVEYLCCSCVEYLWCSCVECLSCYCVDYLGCSWLISYIQSDSDE